MHPLIKPALLGAGTGMGVCLLFGLLARPKRREVVHVEDTEDVPPKEKTVPEKLEEEWHKVEGDNYAESDKERLTKVRDKFEQVVKGIQDIKVMKSFQFHLLMALRARNSIAGVSENLGDVANELMAKAEKKLMTLSRRSDCGLTADQKRDAVSAMINFLKGTI